MMNDLEKYFHDNTGPLIWKWQHYFDIYDRYFAPYRGKQVVILEIGVFQGGSLSMWQSYFGPQAKIYGIDINPDCKQFESENVTIFIGDQSDKNFLQSLKEQIPPIDILIDDGSHVVNHQIATFLELYDHIAPNGIYLCEDLHTSYWHSFQGGYRKPGTFIEFAKQLVDSLHAWYSKEEAFKPDRYTTSMYSLHFYDSILVLLKRPIQAPKSLRSGNKTIAADFPEDYNAAVPVVKKVPWWRYWGFNLLKMLGKR